MVFLVKTPPSLAILKEGEYIDPEFLTLDNMSMQDSLHCPPYVIADKLAHQITRHPNDLRSHAQRIFIFIEQDKARATYGSLIDLFLVLENKGLALRKRMLLSAKHSLTAEQFCFLQQSLSLGLASDTVFIEANYSLLSQGCKSTTSFIHKTIKENSANIIEQARGYLEYGQIDQARILLEEAILNEPEKLEYHQDLLEIFQSIGERMLFISFYEQLLKHNSKLPLLWEQLADEFNYETVL